MRDCKGEEETVENAYLSEQDPIKYIRDSSATITVGYYLQRLVGATSLGAIGWLEFL